MINVNDAKRKTSTRDENAKRAAEILSDREETGDEVKKIYIETIYKMIKEQQIKQWQRSWENTGSGRHTKDLFPSVRSKVIWANQRSTDISYARMLLNSTNLNDHLFRMKYSESPNCQCNEGRETIDHLMMECHLHKEQRENMMKVI